MSYPKAVLFVHAQRFQDPSVINASLISAVQGQYGNFHLTEKTKGSRLWISPLMPIYWFFDLPGVAERNLFLDELRLTDTFSEALRATSTRWIVSMIPMPRPVVIPLIAWAYWRLGFIRVAESTNQALRCSIAWRAYCASPVIL